MSDDIPAVGAYVPKNVGVYRAAREAALAMIATGQEPPWAWYRYMQLVEACDAIVAGNPPISAETMSRIAPESRVVELVRLPPATSPSVIQTPGTWPPPTPAQP